MLVHDGRVQLFKVAGMGPYNNNGYVIADPITKEAYIIDAPKQIERLLAEAQGFQLKAALITHTHPDHIAGYEDLLRLTGLPVAVHPADADRLPGKPAFHLEDRAELTVGQQRIRLLHTPGHTPGGICLLVDECLVSGDTLFPGGPGMTRSAEAFKQLVESITKRLLTLPLGHGIYPGHGDDTSVAASKREYGRFNSKPRAADLFGTVRWDDP